ncbi:Shikimate dehydrogenase [Stanieria cyanosphaera PCC 7437]|uniref:Shikimate dehydrogenase (NADP(+)) n=1 Tax=Stanieria cyanosphaera (strain ATCC 29371 / PCC 7437) TaxID=111780 RepID=K9XMW5_STAC7|nr:shikimate dehydrogenase [Stanieria cyanosphaera]AFZ33853.1 Shikimate dehydrogenase [Stanieria cyanosphaera PCC 7437]
MVLITGATKLLGIIGDPVEHSLSPVMHNAAIEQMGIDYVYIPFPVKPNNLAIAIAGFATIDLIGFSVTIPHKQAIIPLLSEVTPEAEMIGAVNTVWRTKVGWQGTNTDVIGFVAPLQNLERNWHQVTPVILGNGGAARAVIVGLIQLGCQEIHIVGRNKDKMAQFYQSWQDNREIIKKLKIHYWEGLNALLPAAELLINTTPIGMYPQVEQSPIDAQLFKKLSSDAIVYDLIYTPNPTKFLQLAQKQGAIIIDGLEMLVQQGVAALEIWLQQPVPVDVMRQSLQRHLI